MYIQYGRQLLDDLLLTESLERLMTNAKQLVLRMGDLELGMLCCHCASQEGGGCCSQFMENENEVLQIVMNMLAGVEVVINQEEGAACCLLGERGCVLVFKPIFCFNYNCRAIKSSALRGAFEQYERWSGKLLQEQCVLEELLLVRLRRLGAVV